MSGRIRNQLPPGYWELASKAAVALFLLLFFLRLGRMLGSGTSAGFMLAVFITGIVVVAFRPLAGFYLCYALLIIVPVTDQAIDFPIFHSPLQAIAFMTIGAALLRFPNSGRRVPRSSIYLPLAVVSSLYVIFTLTSHGDAPAIRLYDFVAGLWPLILIVLLVETPRQARNVLLSMCATCVGLTVLWLPGLLALSQSKSGQLGAQIRAGRKIAGFEANPGAISLLGVFGALGVQTLVSLALVAIVLLGLVVGTRKWFWPSLFGFIAIALTVFTATIASAVATLSVGVVAVIVFFAIPSANESLIHKAHSVVRLVLVAVLVTAVGLSTPPGQRALERLTNPRNDVSGEVRLNSLETGWHAFLESPWIGLGSVDFYRLSPGGYPLAGHNTFGVMAYEFGLLMLIPFAWMLFTIGRAFWRLLQTATTQSEAGLAAAFLACFAAAVVTGFITPTFGQVFQDTILWTLVGLTIVWTEWRREDPDAVLMAGTQHDLS